MLLVMLLVLLLVLVLLLLILRRVVEVLKDDVEDIDSGILESS